jgi:hypothetical protein
MASPWSLHVCAMVLALQIESAVVIVGKEPKGHGDDKKKKDSLFICMLSLACTNHINPENEMNVQIFLNIFMLLMLLVPS